MTESVGVLLAGGLARRMGGGDKCLRPLAGETLLARVIARAAPQVGPLILNANGDPARFASYGLPVVADVVEGHAGPLAGADPDGARLGGREGAPLPAGGELRHRCTVPAAPNLVETMANARGPRPCRRRSCLRRFGRPDASGVRALAGGAPRRLAPGPGRAGAERKIDRWTASHRLVEVDVFPCDPLQWTRSSTPTARRDLAEAERLIAEHGPHAVLP